MAQSMVEYPFIDSEQIELLAERTLVDFFDASKRSEDAARSSSRTILRLSD